jgi:hypothetical protein
MVHPGVDTATADPCDPWRAKIRRRQVLENDGTEIHLALSDRLRARPGFFAPFNVENATETISAAHNNPVLRESCLQGIYDNRR